MSIAARSIISLPAPISPHRRSDVVRTEDPDNGETVSFRLPWVVDAPPEELPIELPSTVAYSQRAATQATLAAVVEDLPRTGLPGDANEHNSNNTTGGGGLLPPESGSQVINFEKRRAAETKDSKTLWVLGLATVGFIATSLVVHLTSLFGDLKKPLGLLSDSISIFLATCFGAGLLSLRSGVIDSSDNTYSNS